MRTPLEKRLPVVAGIAVALIAAVVVSGSLWVRLVVLVAVLVAWALMLHYVFGLPWSRISRYKEPTADNAGSGTGGSHEGSV